MKYWRLPKRLSTKCLTKKEIVTVDYNKLSKEEFDAIVTGEMTHFALWLEEELNEIICDYFLRENVLREDFKRLILRREGLTFQDKIDIVQGMLPIFGKEADAVELKSLLNRIEQFKSWRNALAHGLDVPCESSGLKLRVEVMTRSGKGKTIEIDPNSHQIKMAELEELLNKVQAAREHLRTALKRA
jgi:hypothetical protein